MSAIDIAKSIMSWKIAGPAGMCRAEATSRSKVARVPGPHQYPSAYS
jgi:hypothetical protein